MKRLLTITALAMLVPSIAIGQGGGAIGVFEDPWLSCGINDLAPGLVEAYVIHFAMQGATASRFTVSQGVGANLIYLFDTSDFGLTEGNVQTGLTVCYTDCLESPVVVTRVMYFGQGLSLPCSEISVTPHPASANRDVEAVDCAGNTVAVHGFVNYINGWSTCWCGLSDQPAATTSQEDDVIGKAFPVCETVPTEESSWGRIKELYKSE